MPKWNPFIREGKPESMATHQFFYFSPDQYPTFKGCEELSDSLELKICQGKKRRTYYYQKMDKAKVKKRKMEGYSTISYVVNEKGEISDAKIEIDAGGNSGREALRIVNEMPKLNPALDKGKPVSITMILKFDFNRDHFRKTVINWNGMEMKGKSWDIDGFVYKEVFYCTKSYMEKSTLIKLLSEKEKMPAINIYFDEKEFNITEYYMRLEDTKELIQISDSKINREERKKIINGLKSDKRVYFYHPFSDNAFWILGIL